MAISLLEPTWTTGGEEGGMSDRRRSRRGNAPPDAHDEVPEAVVAQEFAGENRSADNLINALRRIVLVKNACFGRIGDADPDAVNQLVERFGIDIGKRPRRGSDAEWFSKQLYDPFWHVALRQHRGQLPHKRGISARAQIRCC